MASRRRMLRSAAQAAQQENDAVADLDYFGTFVARHSKNRHDAESPGLRTRPVQTSRGDRASRVLKTTAAKRGPTEKPEGQAASTRQSKRQRGLEAEEVVLEESDDEDRDENEDEEVDGVNHDLTALAMNQAQHAQRTVNGIRARQNEQPQEEVESDDEHEEGERIEADDDDDLYMSQSSEEPRGQRQHTSSNVHDGNNLEPSRNKRTLDDLYEFQASPEKPRPKQKIAAGTGPVANKAPRQVKRMAAPERGRIANKQTAPRQTNQPTTGRRRPPVQDQESDDESVSSREEQAHGSNTVNVAEDLDFIEAPRPHEQLVSVKVSINSLGGIMKTLQHQAWTNMVGWDRSFERNGDVTACSTATGRVLMKAIMGLRNLLERAVEAQQDNDEDEDEHDAAVDYLRGKSVDAKRHLGRINQAVNTICTEGLAQPPPAADESSAKKAIKARQRLLRDILRRLIPMLILAVRDTCCLAPTENHGSKMVIYFNSFTLQFFLRTLGWTTRLHNALGRGLQEWPFEAEFRDEEDLHENERKAKRAKTEAREAFGEQLFKLDFIAKDAERNIQEVANRAARQRREAIMLQRRMEQARLAQYAREQKEREERQRKEKQLAAFARFTQALRHNPGSMQQLSLEAQDVRGKVSRRSEQPGPSSQSRVQRVSGTVRFETDPSRAAPIDGESEDPFDFDPYADDPSPNRNTNSHQYAHNCPSGAHAAHRSSQVSRPWLYEEEKALIKAIRYDRTYNLASMAAELGRPEDDVARKVASLKQGYRAVYIERGEEIPAWAL